MAFRKKNGMASAPAMIDWISRLPEPGSMYAMMIMLMLSTLSGKPHEPYHHARVDAGTGLASLCAMQVSQRGLPAIHPILFAAWPVLFLFSENLDEQVTLEPLFLPLGLSVAGAVALFALTWLALREVHRAALFTSIAVVLFFLYGHAWNLLDDHPRLQQALPTGWLIVGALSLAASALIRRSASGLTLPLNLIAAGLVMINAVPITGYALQRAAEREPADVPGIRTGTPSAQVERPDIYYLIPDRYANERTLREIYDFDNRPFLDELEARGFFVASESTSNYLKTAHSLASSLSMDYLDGEALLREAVTPDDWAPLYERLLSGLPVQEFLTAQGYTYYHLGMLWPPTAENELADVTFRFTGLSDFSAVLIETTVLRAVAPDMVERPTLDRRARAAAITLYQFDGLEQLARIESGPKFVFAHFSLPHPPYVFDRHGNYRTREEEGTINIRDRFLDQTLYANKRFLELIDLLLAGPEEEHPVILIQSDEGPFPREYGIDEHDFQWLEATDDELQEKLGILNVMYLPGVDDPGLPETTTPVNLFRRVLNLYFGAELDLLPDRNYVFTDGRNFYEFHDVTDRLAERRAAD
jgi:hypothetical protein